MKQFAFAIPRWQDPEKIYNSGEYLKIRAELNELENKLLNLFFKFAETGKLEDLQALRNTLPAYYPKWQEVKQGTWKMFDCIDESLHRLFSEITLHNTEEALIICMNKIATMKLEGTK